MSTITGNEGPKVTTHCSFFVEKGNKGHIIKKLLNTRPWWHEVDGKGKASTINFVWTQNNNDTIQSSMKALWNKEQS